LVTIGGGDKTFILGQVPLTLLLKIKRSGIRMSLGAFTSERDFLSRGWIGRIKEGIPLLIPPLMQSIRWC